MEDTNSPAAPTFTEDPSRPILQIFVDSDLRGIVPNLAVTVPPGYAAVAVKKDAPTDVLAEGAHTISIDTLPQFFRGAKPNAEGVWPGRLYLVKTGAKETVNWECRALLSESAALGLTMADLKGRCAVRIFDPGRFCAMMFAFGKKAAKASNFADAPAEQQALFFLRANIIGQTREAVKAMKLQPDQMMGMREPLRAAIGQAAAQWLQSVGAQCLAFDLDSVSEPLRAPCAGCGSTTAPTAYGHFHRTISLFYVRFTHEKKGNFCVSCAVKTCSAYNAVMLVAGWWGIIGIVLTPIYFFMNLYHLCKIAFGPKAATQVDLAGGGGQNEIWPPPPQR